MNPFSWLISPLFFVVCHPQVTDLSVEWHVCGGGAFFTPFLARCLALSGDNNFPLGFLYVHLSHFQWSYGERKHNMAVFNIGWTTWLLCHLVTINAVEYIFLLSLSILWLQQATLLTASPHSAAFFLNLGIGMRPNELKQKNYVFYSELPKTMVALPFWCSGG